MEKTEIKYDQQNAKQKTSRFKDRPIFARTTFLIGITAIIITGILMVLSAYSSMGTIFLIILLCLTFVFAIVGAIFGGLSFRKGINVFSVIGFILNLILVAALPYGIYQTIRLHILF